ncbi:hypothetical protein ACG2F4_08780 [Halalkalibaculum sp. DA3122]|uniref:hypothetical protein n=1 Tax=unclassified Halalkalibaculum TaxID=2964617 RepID=UPI0037550650
MKIKAFRAEGIGTILASWIMVFTVSGVLCAQEIQSDYQIQQEYRAAVQSVKAELDEVSSQAEARETGGRIDSLESFYAEHAALINKAIYPATFEEQITELKNRARIAYNNLARIARQEAKLNQLDEQLDRYGDRLARLNARADSLQAAVQNSVASEKELSGQLRNYRESLERRDALILSFIDSVIVTYQNMEIASIGDLEQIRSENRLKTDRSPLTMIRTIPSESMQLLESNSELGTGDYLRMKKVQEEFAQMWETVGSKFSEAYSVNPRQTESEIQQAALRWEQALNERLWTSLNQSFKEADIELKKFDDPNSLYEALNTYVEQGFTQSKQDSGEKTYQDFSRFSDFWNHRVKGQWTPGIIQAEILTSAQIATIDQKTNQWATVAKPESNLLAYLLGVSVLAVAVLGFMLFREKTAEKK